MAEQPPKKREPTALGPGWRPGRLAQAACLLEVTARKPGNVHRHADLPGLHLIDFLLSATAISDALDRAETAGVGAAVLEAIEATRRVVDTNTNLGIVLLLAPLAAVPASVPLANGIDDVLKATTVEDARNVYRAIRLAQPGGLGEVPNQDIAREPTITLREVMALAAGRDSIARQYTNGFREVLSEALPALSKSLERGRSLETAIIATHLRLLARHADSLIERKYGHAQALEVSRRAGALVETEWAESDEGRLRLEAFDSWLRLPVNRFNPGTTADLVTAALFAGLRDGVIMCPVGSIFGQ